VLIRLGRIIVVVGLAITLGAHWMLLQTVAWTTMLADNLHDHSFTEAVTCTFDGKHPCCLCKAIAAGKKSEQKREFALQKQELKFTPAKENNFLFAPTQFELLPLAGAFADSLTQKPPTPPPRRIFV
jgi:hypothetical protein